jgi:hypothetical protein
MNTESQSVGRPPETGGRETSLFEDAQILGVNPRTLQRVVAGKLPHLKGLLKRWKALKEWQTANPGQTPKAPAMSDNPRFKMPEDENQKPEHHSTPVEWNFSPEILANLTKVNLAVVVVWFDASHYPDVTRLSGGNLAQVLADALNAAGSLKNREPEYRTGDKPACVFHVGLADVQDSLKTVAHTLGQLDLAQFVFASYWDPECLSFRRFFPSTGESPAVK